MVLILLMLVDKILQIIVEWLYCELFVECEQQVVQIVLLKFQDVLKSVHQDLRLVVVKTWGRLKANFHHVKNQLVQIFLQCFLGNVPILIYKWSFWPVLRQFLVILHRIKPSPDIVSKIDLVFLNDQKSLGGKTANTLILWAVVVDHHVNSRFNMKNWDWQNNG